MSTERYLTIEEAALELAELTFDKDDMLAIMESWDIPETEFDNRRMGKIASQQKSFINRLNDARNQGHLTVREPENKLPYSPKIKRDFFEVISVTDLNAWLEKSGVDYRLKAKNQGEPKQLKSEADESEDVEDNADPAQEICGLFDPINKVAISTLFNKVTQNEWRSYFERAARNGLSDARQGDVRPFQYNPAKVADWLVQDGLYTREHADRKLAKNLPERNKDKMHLITGDFE